MCKKTSYLVEDGFPKGGQEADKAHGAGGGRGSFPPLGQAGYPPSRGNAAILGNRVPALPDFYIDGIL